MNVGDCISQVIPLKYIDCYLLIFSRSVHYIENYCYAALLDLRIEYFSVFFLTISNGSGSTFSNKY